MKEFQSTIGGRHAYNSDFKNLQELALAMQEVFRECGGNFVISGCKVSSGSTVSVSEGYVYINNKVCKVAAASNLQTSNLCIIPKEKNGDTIIYADGNDGVQYIDYYAEAVNTTSPGPSYIAFDNTTKEFANLSTVFFNYYAVCKRADNQSIDKLTVADSLTVLKQLLAPQGVLLNGSNVSITREGTEICLNNGVYSLCFSNTGVITLKGNQGTIFSFSNGSGSGLVTFENMTVQSNLRTKKLYINGIDFEQKLVPLGTIQMWAGAKDKIPTNYRLCNGDALSITEYPELYDVLGDNFNNKAKGIGEVMWSSPGTGFFRLPDLRRRFIVGADFSSGEYNYIGQSGGSARVVLTTSEMPSHTHNVNDYYYIENWGTAHKHAIYGSSMGLGGSYTGSEGTDGDNNAILYKTHESKSAGSNNSHENRPPFYSLAYIIRVK